MKITRFLFLLTVFVLMAGCATSTHTDPLAGWHFSSLNNLHSNQAITDDYQAYIQTLHLKKRGFVGAVDFFEDGTGQHAVKIEIGLNGTWSEHVIIYDKDNKRTKVTKYADGRYSQW
jgi:hypothetical protein